MDKNQMEIPIEKKLKRLRSELWTHDCIENSGDNMLIIYLNKSPFFSKNIIIGWTKNFEYFIFNDGNKTYLTKDVWFKMCSNYLDENPCILETSFFFIPGSEYEKAIQIDIRKKLLRFWVGLTPYKVDKIIPKDVDDIISEIDKYREKEQKIIEQEPKVNSEETSKVPKKIEKEILTEKPWDYLLNYFKSIGKGEKIENDKIVGIQMKLIDDRRNNKEIQYRIGFTPVGDVYVSTLYFGEYGENIKCRVFNFMRKKLVGRDKDELIMYPKEIGEFCTGEECKGLVYIDNYLGGDRKGTIRIGFGMLFDLENYEKIDFYRADSFRIENIEFETI